MIHDSSCYCSACTARDVEFARTFVSAEGRPNPNLHPVYGWPIAGSASDEPQLAVPDTGARRVHLKGRPCYKGHATAQQEARFTERYLEDSDDWTVCEGGCDRALPADQAEHARCRSLLVYCGDCLADHARTCLVCGVE